VKSADVIGVRFLSLEFNQIKNITNNDFVFEGQALQVTFEGEVIAGRDEDIDRLIPKRGFTPKRGSLQSGLVLGVPSVIVTFNLWSMLLV
jgi:hypothetical protein